MPHIRYIAWEPARKSQELIVRANSIIDEYAAQGFDLTLRQLYYQFVARGWLENKQSNYKRLGDIVNKARLAGLIDWNAIVDRTRSLHKLASWDDEGEIVQASANSFRTDRWARQPFRIEVWIEKEALAGVFQRVCDELHVPFFAARGYPSQSSVWRAAQRIKQWDQKVVVLHFGDHDPSGIDMTRDIQDRLWTFGCEMDLQRLALNMDQVDEHQPPPNPAKVTDSRYEGYVVEYGEESWELDALEPSILADLVRSKVEEIRDQDLWDDATEEDEESQRILGLVADNYEEVKDWVIDRSFDE